MTRLALAANGGSFEASGLIASAGAVEGVAASPAWDMICASASPPIPMPQLRRSWRRWSSWSSGRGPCRYSDIRESLTSYYTRASYTWNEIVAAVRRPRPHGGAEPQRRLAPLRPAQPRGAALRSAPPCGHAYLIDEREL